MTMDRRLMWTVDASLLFAATVALFSFGTTGTTALWNASQGGHWLLPLVVVAALIDSVNPCAFSILLLTMAFLLSVGKLRSSVLQIGIAYIAGLFFVYFMIGLGLLQTLHLFDTPHFMATVGAVLLVALGVINIANEFVPAFPIKLAIPHSAHRRMAVLMERASIPTAVALGALVGICEFPCTGGPYLMAVGLLHDHATYYAGVGYLLLYNAIFVLPLVLILLIASNGAMLAKVQQWQQEKRRAMRLGGGSAMIALGLFVFAM
jgi:cytochrome c-type biogenesis protein